MLLKVVLDVPKGIKTTELYMLFRLDLYIKNKQLLKFMTTRLVIF